jgi:predicted transcriptional regulator
MSIHPSALGPLEQQILEIVWRAHPVPVQDVLDQVNQSNQKNLAYTTVMTIMTRLVDKGVLRRAKDGRTYFYSPQKDKRQFLKSLVQSTIANVVDQYGQEAMAAFIEETQQLSTADRQKIISKLR